jgi:hypothetical protein
MMIRQFPGTKVYRIAQPKGKNRAVANPHRCCIQLMRKADPGRIMLPGPLIRRSGE